MENYGSIEAWIFILEWIKIEVVVYLLLYIVIIVIAFLVVIFYVLGNNKKIVRKIEGIGYVALFASVGWNIIYEMTKSTIDNGQYLTLKEQLQSIWIYLDHLSSYLNHQDVNLSNHYNSLNLHLINFKNGESYAREQYDLARKIQWFLTVIATSFTAIGKIHDIVYKEKEDFSTSQPMSDVPPSLETAKIEENQGNSAKEQNVADNGNGGGCIYRYTLNVFKDMYYHELTTKETLNSRVSVPLTTLSIVATLIVYYISKSEGLPNLTVTSALLCLYYSIIISIACLIVYSAILLLLVFHGRRYAQSPSPKVIDDYVRQVEQCYACCPEEEKEARITQDINSYLNDLYRDATDENSKNNHEKIKHIRRANICIIIALLLCILNAIPLFLLNKV